MTARRGAWITAGLASSLALAAFYRGYVPLARSFQEALLPAALLVMGVTLINVRAGLALFVFLFPLVNGLPYVFGIRENIPHAPTALVLCLFFLLGWVWGRAVRPAPPRPRPAFFVPLGFFSLLVAGSALVTIWRYANFFPLLSGRLLELKANVEGTSTGGAIQSSLFFALNYLTAAAFIYVFLEAADRGLVLRVLSPLLAGAVSVSLAVAFYQRFADIGWGNNLRGIEQGLANATFKDCISCGVFLAMAAPLLMGRALAAEGRTRALYLVLLAPLAYVILFAGARGGWVGLMVALALAAAWAVRRRGRPSADGTARDPRLRPMAVVFLSALALLVVLAVVRRPAPQFQTLTRWRSLWTLSTTQFAASPRGRLWQTAWAMMKDYPVTGVGVGGFVIEASNFARLHSIPGVISQSAENYGLQAGAELGWPGLLLLFWLAAAIVRDLFSGRRGPAATPEDGPSRDLRFGALAGCAVFLVNVPFHAFIGSYEIKYMVWLLLGIALVLGNRPGQAKTPRLRSWIRVLVPALLGLCFGATAWNALHSLSLEHRSEALAIRQEFGFFPTERTAAGNAFRWTGRRAGMEVRTSGPALLLPLRASHPDIRRRPVDIRVFVSDRFFRGWEPLGSVRLADDGPHAFELSWKGRSPGKRYIMLEVGRTWSPRRELGTPDPRDLGVAVAGRFFESDPPDRSVAPAGRRQQPGA